MLKFRIANETVFIFALYYDLVNLCSEKASSLQDRRRHIMSEGQPGAYWGFSLTFEGLCTVNPCFRVRLSLLNRTSLAQVLRSTKEIVLGVGVYSFINSDHKMCIFSDACGSWKKTCYLLILHHQFGFYFLTTLV